MTMIYKTWPSFDTEKETKIFINPKINNKILERIRNEQEQRIVNYLFLKGERERSLFETHKINYQDYRNENLGECEIWRYTFSYPIG